MNVRAIVARLTELARYSVVGLICFFVTNGVLAALRELGHMPYVAAYVCAFLAATVVGYVLHARFTFAGTGLQNASPSRFLLVNVINLVSTSLQFWLLVDCFRVWYLAASISLAIINIPINFLIHRRVSYGLRDFRAERTRALGSP